MNSFYQQTKSLITNQDTRTLFATGAYGDWVNVARFREMDVVAAVSGSGIPVVVVQGRSPFNSNDGFDLVRISWGTGGISGYRATGVTLPVGEIRAFCSGSGTFWASAILRN